MKKLFLIFYVGISSVGISSVAQQDNETAQYFIKQDSFYLFVDDTQYNWYTIDIPTDTMFHIEKNIYYWGNDKTIQFVSVDIDIEKMNPVSVFGFQKAEKYNLLAFKNWELKYHSEQYNKKLKSGKEFYLNSKGKTFLIWWFKNPKGNWSTREVKIPLIDSKHSSEKDETDAIISEKTLESAYQLYLTFIIHGCTAVMISIPVWENEKLKSQIQRLKTIANSLNVYGSYIDFDVLIKRLKNENIVVQDSLNLIEFEAPAYLNAVHSARENSFYATFPEKDYVTNAIGVTWEYKTDSLSFLNFIERTDYSKKENLKILEDTDTVKRFFFTDNRDWFYSQTIYLKGINIYCMINFTATKSTYDYNVERFYEFVKTVKLK